MARELSFTEHLGELRRRVLICALAIVVGTGASFAFFDEIIAFLVRPSGLETGKGGQLIITEVTEFLTTAFKVSVLSGFVLALPIIIYQVIMFVAPALTPKERRLLFGFLPLVLVAFVSGMAFAYFVLTPPALRFLLTFGEEVVTPFIRVSNIVNLMVRLLFWMGVAFETPLIMYLLAQLGIVSSRRLSRFRRVWVVLAFILGALITPTFDPVNQTLVALPLLALYEFGILLARLAERGRRKAETAVAPAVADLPRSIRKRKEPAANRFLFLGPCAVSSVRGAVVPALGNRWVLLVLLVIAKQGRLEGADSLAHGTADFRHSPPPENQQDQGQYYDDFQRPNTSQESHSNPRALDYH